MIDVILLTGFLGSGKTTLLKNLMTEDHNKRIGIIVNDFGAVNIDAKLIHREGIQLAELSNGSIFCACIKAKFIDGLIEMSKKDLDVLIIEASGLSDPANMDAILEGIRPQFKQEMRLQASFCIIDGVTFTKMVRLLPALVNQLRFADVVVVNKADRINPAQLSGISDIVKEYNPNAPIYVTSYCRLNFDEALQHGTVRSKAVEESTNTYQSRLNTFVLHADKILSAESLERFLKAIAMDAYRIKGFANTDLGVREISAVGEDIQIHDWPDESLETNLVVISAVGIALASRIIENSDKYLDGGLRM